MKYVTYGSHKSKVKSPLGKRESGRGGAGLSYHVTQNEVVN